MLNTASTGPPPAPGSAISDAELASAAAALEGAHPREVIGWALTRFEPARRLVITGLQAEGVVIADMAIGLDPSVRVLTIDTGRLPAETHAYLDSLRAHWSRTVEVVHPDRVDLERFSSANGANPFYESVALRLDCCHVRKVEPLERVLRDADCWMSGLRRRQSAARARTPAVERDLRHGGIVKLNPLAAWSSDEVRDHVRRAGLPEHPLYAQGFRSIGCAPCTRAVSAGEDSRAGRWWWESGIDKECGVHATPLAAAL